jgi:iron complex transport system ATP-binding protein
MEERIMATASQTAVLVEQVEWWRGEQHILKNINWQVKSGEHWAILGLNGSGKTTLLQMVAGYLWPSKGRITVLGNQYGRCDLREVRKAIGWVSSVLEERLNPAETVRDIVISGKFASFGLYEEWGEKEVEEAEKIMDVLGCRHLSGHRFGRLSQGEKQKVIIARALMSQPQLLILDEPCNGLDLYAREHLLDTISKLAEQQDGPTLLYVTHHIEEILPVFQCVLLMADGAVSAQGKKEEVLSDQNLTAAYRLAIHIEWREGRPWPQILKRI